jgi:hypothetical protein
LSNEISFDEQEFLNATINEVFDDVSTPIDAKDYDNAYIKPDSVKFYNGTSDKGKPWRRVSMYFTIDDQEQREKTNIENPGAGYGFFLDLTESGGLATGRNRNTDLGALRAALGQESAPWNFSMLDGAGPVRIRVVHETNEDNPNKKRAVVRAVSKQ